MTTPTEQPTKLTFSDDSSIAFLSFEREHRLNPISTDVLRGLHDGLTQVEKNESTRVVVIKGKAGNFTAGADVKHLGSLNEEQRADYMRLEHDLFARLDAFGLILVASISGICFGNGLEIALSCDIRIAGADAKLRYPEIRAGFAGPADRLSRYVGLGRATEILLSGRSLEVNEAQELGLLTEVVSNADLESVTAERAATLAALPQKGVQVTKGRIFEAYKRGGHAQ
jgi:enoyl-CoA hydratase/carnithine racemase